MKIATTQLKHFEKSGARLYIPQKVIEDPDFPFKDGDVIKIEYEENNMTLTRPEWWEIIDWNQMKPAFISLPEEIKDKIRALGLAPE